MIKGSKDKQIKSAPVAKSPAPDLSKLPKQLFHFSGSGKYFPMAIYARTLEDAHRVWNKSKVLYTK